MPRSPVDSGGRGAPRGDSPHPRERRRATRIACEQWIAASFEDQPGEPILLRCCDISTTGLAFVSSRPLPPGLRGAVRIARRNGRSGVVGVEVVRSDYLDESRHVTGLRFAKPPVASIRAAPLVEARRPAIASLLERIAR